MNGVLPFSSLVFEVWVPSLVNVVVIFLIALRVRERKREIVDFYGRCFLRFSSSFGLDFSDDPEIRGFFDAMDKLARPDVIPRALRNIHKDEELRSTLDGGLSQRRRELLWNLSSEKDRKMIWTLNLTPQSPRDFLLLETLFFFSVLSAVYFFVPVMPATELSVF